MNCPRCGEPEGRNCVCFRRLERHLTEAHRHFNCGRPGMAEREVGEASSLLRLMRLDGSHMRGAVA